MFRGQGFALIRFAQMKEKEKEKTQQPCSEVELRKVSSIDHI